MGVSTDAILVFGFEYGEEGEDPEFLGEHEDLDDFIYAKHGKTYDDPYEERQALVRACPIDLVPHCSDDYPMHIIAIRDTETRARRGYAEVINPQSLVISEDKIAAARKWCEGHGIEWQEPKWLLCSMWW